MDINGILIRIIRQTNSGKYSDNIFQLFLPNVLNDSIISHNILIADREDLLVMLNEADDCLIYVSNTPAIVAHYKFSDRYPISRLYYKIFNGLFDLEFPKAIEYYKNKSIKLVRINDEKLLNLLCDKEAVKRVNVYLKNKDANVEKMKEFFAGRRKATSLKKGLFLNSQSCFICDEKKGLINVTSTINSCLYGYVICQKHYQEALDYNMSFINYLFYKYSGKIICPTDDFDSKTHFRQVTAWLSKSSDFKIKNISAEKKTVTLIRESGIALILRLTGPLDYAYMIYSKDGKELIRVDSVRHHPEIDFAPDHMHYHPKDENRLTSSFTTGSPFFDLKGILRMIKDIEKEN